MSSSQKDTTFTKLFVGGLPYHTTDKSLREFFQQHGEIDEAVVITDRVTGKSKGYGFVTMMDEEGARLACKEPNPIIEGRKANVNLAYIGAKPRIPLTEATAMLPQFNKTGAAVDLASLVQGQIGAYPHHYAYQGGYMVTPNGLVPVAAASQYLAQASSNPGLAHAAAASAAPAGMDYMTSSQMTSAPGASSLETAGFPYTLAAAGYMPSATAYPYAAIQHAPAAALASFGTYSQQIQERIPSPSRSMLKEQARPSPY